MEISSGLFVHLLDLVAKHLLGAIHKGCPSRGEGGGGGRGFGKSGQTRT